MADTDETESTDQSTNEEQTQDSATQDSEPAATSDPPESADPNDKGERGELTQQGQADEEDDEYTKQLQNQYKTDVASAEKHSADQQASIDKMQKLQDDLKNTPMPQLQQMPQMSQEQKGTITQNVFKVLAIAAIAYGVFGSRRNSASQGALMGGLGALMKGYMQGREQQAKEGAIAWHQHIESVQKENQARTNEYKEIQANKKLDLTQQMDLMRMKAGFYKDGQMERHAAAGDLAKIHQNILEKEKAQKKIHDLVPKESQEEKNYDRLVQEKSGLDPKSKEGQDWALHNYPYSQYLNEKKTPITTDPVTGKKSGGYSGAATGGTDAGANAKSALDKAMDKDFGAIKPQGSPAPTPARAGSQKSVFDKSDFASPDYSGEDDGSGL